MTKKELLEMVCNMANACLDCKYPDGLSFNKMKSRIDNLKDPRWHEASFGDTSDGSALLRKKNAFGADEQMKIWLDSVAWNNSEWGENLSIKLSLPNISICYACYEDKGEPQIFVDCTINTRKPHDLRFRGGKSQDHQRQTEWGWTRWGTLNGHRPGETDPYYLNMDYWDDIVDPDVMY